MSSDSWDSRTRLLLGDENADRLRAATVMVAGLGGVGVMWPRCWHAAVWVT